MHEGRLLCVGSPFDLRRRFGGGYRLRLLLRLDPPGLSPSEASGNRNTPASSRGREGIESNVAKNKSTGPHHGFGIDFAADPLISRIVCLLEQSLQDSRQCQDAAADPSRQWTLGPYGGSSAVASDEMCGGGSAAGSVHVKQHQDSCNATIADRPENEARRSPITRERKKQDDTSSSYIRSGTPHTGEQSSVKRRSREPSFSSCPESRRSAHSDACTGSLEAVGKVERLGTPAEVPETRVKEETAQRAGDAKERRGSVIASSSKPGHLRGLLSSGGTERFQQHRQRVLVERINVAPGAGDLREEMTEDHEGGSEWANGEEVEDLRGGRARVRRSSLRRTESGNDLRSFGRNENMSRSLAARGRRNSRQRKESSGLFLEVTLRIPLDSET